MIAWVPLNSSVLKVFWARLPALLPLVIAGIPPALLVATVVRYSVNVPIGDQWELVPYLVEMFEERLRVERLWAQHNEHRILLPRLVMLGLAKATGWDVRYEIATSVALASGLFAVLVLLLRQTVRPLAPTLYPWLILVASLMTFSLAQWENWLFGWQLQVFMNALAAAVTVWALARWGSRWPGVALALLAAVAGVFSFATGLILLALVPLGLLLFPQRANGKRLLAPAIAASVAVGVAALYLAGFRYPSHHPTPFFLFSHPLEYCRYVLVYIGAAVSSWRTGGAAALGAMGLVAFAWGSVWLWVRSPAHRPALLPWLLLAFYAILSGLMTGVGRAGFGVTQALESRYVTISSLFWVSLVVVVSLTIARVFNGRTVSRLRARVFVALTASVVTLGTASYVMSWTQAEAIVKRRHEFLRRAEEWVLHYDRVPGGCLEHLSFWDPPRIRASACQLKTLALGPFSLDKREQDQLLSWYSVAVGPEPAGWIDKVYLTDSPPIWTRCLDDAVVSGWVKDPFRESTVASVLVVADGQVMGRAMIGQRRSAGQKGWTFRFGAFRLGPGPRLVEAYALLKDGRSIVSLAGARMIEGN